MIDASIVFDSSGLRAAEAKLLAGVQGAARQSVTVVGKAYERKLEAATEAAGLGRLARAWNSTVYPKTGVAEAPTVSIYPKGKTRTLGAILAYSKGARIKGTRGQYLAIPLPAAGQKRTGGRNSVPLTPKEWERRTGLTLRFVYRRNRPSLLVLDEGKLGGKRGVARLNKAKSGRGSTTVPIFVLLKQVDVGKRFDIPTVMRGADAALAADYVARVGGIIAAFNAAT